MTVDAAFTITSDCEKVFAGTLGQKKKNHQLALKNNENSLLVFKSADSFIAPSYHPERLRSHMFPTWYHGPCHVKEKLKGFDDFDLLRSQLHYVSDQKEASEIVHGISIIDRRAIPG